MNLSIKPMPLARGKRKICINTEITSIRCRMEIWDVLKVHSYYYQMTTAITVKFVQCAAAHGIEVGEPRHMGHFTYKIQF